MGAVASELLAQSLAEEREQTSAAPLRWIRRDLGLPMVDLEDKEPLQMLLDEDS